MEELQIEEDSEIGNINNYILGKKDVPTSGGIINSFNSNQLNSNGTGNTSAVGH